MHVNNYYACHGQMVFYFLKLYMKCCQRSSLDYPVVYVIKLFQSQENMSKLCHESTENIIMQRELEIRYSKVMPPNFDKVIS